MTTLTIVKQPKGFRTKLYRHQLRSIYEMEQMEEKQEVANSHGDLFTTTLGVQADAAGYGKTSSMIGMIVRDRMMWDMDEPYKLTTMKTTAGGLMSYVHTTEFTRLDTTLIMVSPSLISQWEEELSKTKLSVCTVLTNKHLDKYDVSEFDVVLVNLNMYNKLVAMYSEFAWKRFIYDEPGHARVPNMAHAISGFTWFVTATPNAIPSMHKGCSGSMMLDIVKPCTRYGDPNFETYYGHIIVRNDLESIKQSFTMPQTTYVTHKCKQPMARVVNGFVRDEVITMIEAGNIEGAISALGGRSTDNIVDLVKANKEEELKEAEYKIAYHTHRNNAPLVREWTERKTRIENQIRELEERFDHALDETCPICMDTLDKPVLAPCCQNLFCGECIFQCLRHRSGCPMCRTIIDPRNLVSVRDSETTLPISNSEEPRPSQPQELTKLDKTLQLIKDKPDGKFLVFSGYDETFKPISEALEMDDISFILIKGTAKTMERKLKEYKTGDARVIFLNSKVNSAGLNLQETTDIILYHHMEGNTQRQIIGRAERIGREVDLTVHTLE